VLDTAPEAPRMPMSAQTTTSPRIPRQLSRAWSSDRAQDNLPLDRLEVAEQLLTLVPGPNQPILGAAPRPTQPPGAVEAPSTAWAVTSQTASVGSPTTPDCRADPEPGPLLASARIFAAG
jgi:hypothetical protein